MPTAPLLVALFLAALAALGAWHLHNTLATPGANPGAWIAPFALAAPVGRHRLGTFANPYRPWDVPVIPGPGPLTEAEERARMIPAPIPEPAWRTADTEVMVIAGHDDRPRDAAHDDTRELAQL